MLVVFVGFSELFHS